MNGVPRWLRAWLSVIVLGAPILIAVIILVVIANT
jgi:hypothetical protein